MSTTEGKTNEAKATGPSIDDAEIGMFDQLFYYCVPLLGKYGEDYELLEPMLATRIPQKYLASLPTAVSSALREPLTSEPFEANGTIRLPAMDGDYAFPQSLRLKALGRGVISFTVAESQGPMFVGFSGAPIPFDPMVEVTLGMTHSTIASRRDSSVLAMSATPLQEGQRFWVHLFDGQVCVGKGEISEQNIFMSAYYPCGQREREGPWDRLANVGFGGFKHAVALKDVTLEETVKFLAAPVLNTVAVQPNNGSFIFPTHLQLPQRGLGAFSFTLQGAEDINNVWLSVTEGPFLHNSMAEIVIGGWENTRSVVFSSHLQPIVCECNTKAEVGKRYWVSLSPHRISVGVGDVVGQNTVMWAGYPRLNRLKQVGLGGYQLPVVYADLKMFVITENEPGNIQVVSEYAYGAAPVASTRNVERPGQLAAESEQKVAAPTVDFFLVVHGPPPPSRDQKPQCINVMPHTWAMPTLQFEQNANVTKNIWMGVFAPSAGVLPLPSRPARDRFGLNLGGPVAFGAMHPRIAVVHDRRFSPNNAQFELSGGRHIESFFLVSADEGESIGNGAQFNGPDESVRGPRRRCVSLHVIVGSSAMKDLLFRPCNQPNFAGFLKALEEVAAPEALREPLAQLKQQLQGLST